MIDNIFLCAGDEASLFRALGSSVSQDERENISRLAALGLPPIVSIPCLSVMTGFHPGFITFLLDSQRNYRIFNIPKGSGHRRIESPRVGLKILQKWISLHLQKCHQPIDSVYGFVPGRSHIDAAIRHANSDWVFSVDIENFFPSTPISRIESAFRRVGYGESESRGLLSKLCSIDGRLPQGSPASPILSNICFHAIDKTFEKASMASGINYTRYADDLVFSGVGAVPEQLENFVRNVISNSPWKINQRKIDLQIKPSRLKVHGLLVGGGRVKLTKGYRKKIRLYEYLNENYSGNLRNRREIDGHLSYARWVNGKNNSE